jgi:hypothetical protein
MGGEQEEHSRAETCDVLDGGGHELAMDCLLYQAGKQQQETASPKPAMLGLVVQARAQQTIGWDGMV